MIWPIVPIPYRLFFEKKAELTHFFNFFVPPGVGGKTVATVHDMAYKAFPETVRFKTKMIQKLSLKRSCKRADMLITVSQFSKAEIIKYLNVPPEKIAVVPCGVDVSVFHPGQDEALVKAAQQRYGISGDYFLYLGTLEPRKNIERLVEAYARLKEQNPGAPKLVLAGGKGWLYDSIFQRVEALALQSDVVFTGYVADENVPRLLAGALAFVFPSLYEGFGIPPLEAMACGTPVLTSDCSSLPEVVGDCAVLVDPMSADSITQGLLRLTTDKKLREDLSHRGVERAKEFSWERAAGMTLDVYKAVLGEK